MTINRRTWLARGGAGALGSLALPRISGESGETESRGKPLELSQYEPRSMLHVKQTEMVQARYPVIDIHTHLSHSARQQNGVPLAPERVFLADPSFLLPVMDRHNIHALNNLTGGFGPGLVECVQKYDKRLPWPLLYIY